MTLFEYADRRAWEALRERYRAAGHGQRSMRLRALQRFVAALLRDDR